MNSVPVVDDPCPIEPVAPWRELVVRIQQSLMRRFFAGGEASRLRDTLEQWALGPCDLLSLSTAQSKAEAFDGLLVALCAAEEQHREEHRQTISSLFALLKESLLVLSSGSDRTISTYSTIDGLLEKATQTQDLAQIKTQVGEIRQFVQKKLASERKDGQRALSNLNHRFAEAGKASAHLRSQRRGREHAIEAVKTSHAGESLWAAVVVFEHIDAIRSRYGDSAVVEITEELLRRCSRITAAQVEPFSWSPDSLLLLISSGRDLDGVKENIASAVPSPFDFRLFLGLRTASLNVTLRWKVMSTRQQDWTEIADSFVGATAEPVRAA